MIPGVGVECVKREPWLKSNDFRLGDDPGVWANPDDRGDHRDASDTCLVLAEWIEVTHCHPSLRRRRRMPSSFS